MRYRPDIDGLRALAIVPVLFFHAKLGLFGGGFVGVDIFFVISGYLITRIILGDMVAGRYSILHFYERRARRIAPALAVTLLATTAAALAILLPADLRAYGSSLVATTLFVSNIYFWRQAGYFGPEADTQPLLHTWSLAVEEQFYIVFPLLASVALRLPRRIALGLFVVLGLVSFAVSQWGLAYSPTASFYLAPSRTWELLLGAVLAFGLGEARAMRPALAGAMGWAGLALIGVAVFGYTSHTAFPGLAAVPPCGGAALLIAAGSAGGGARASRLLSSTVMVWIGRRSYSMYLIHWPLLALYAYLRIEVGVVERCLLVALAVLLSAASYRWVEQPFRVPGFLSARRVAAGTAFAMAVAIAAGAAFYGLRGLPGRFPGPVLALAAEADDHNGTACLDRSNGRIRAGDLCQLGDPAAVPDTLVWGDSHGWAQQHLIDDAFRAQKRAALIASRGGCVPLFAIRREQYGHKCDGWASAVGDLLARDGRLHTVILVGNWAGYLDMVMSPLALPAGAEAEPKGGPVPSRLASTVDALLAEGKRVVVFDPLPGAPFNVPRGAAVARQFGTPLPAPFSRDAFLAKVGPVLDVIAGARARGVGEVALWRDLCADGTCRYREGDALLYSDENHPTLKGLGPGAVDAIVRAIAPAPHLGAASP